MNNKLAKKVRKAINKQYIPVIDMLLKPRPKYMPLFIWDWITRIIINLPK